MEENLEEVLESYWSAIRTGERKDTPPTFPHTTTGDLVIGSAKKVLVRIKPDGTLLYDPEYTPDLAAVEFWEAMARRRVEYEARLILFAHMEQTLLRLGEALLRGETYLSTEASLAVLRPTLELAQGMARGRQQGSALPAEEPPSSV